MVNCKNIICVYVKFVIQLCKTCLFLEYVVRWCFSKWCSFRSSLSLVSHIMLVWTWFHWLIDVVCMNNIVHCCSFFLFFSIIVPHRNVLMVYLYIQSYFFLVQFYLPFKRSPNLFQQIPFSYCWRRGWRRSFSQRIYEILCIIVPSAYLS